MSTTLPLSPLTPSQTGQADDRQGYQATSDQTETTAPRVDEALDSILRHRNDPYVEPREHVAALREEARSLRYRGSDIADGIRKKIEAKPLQAVGVAALIGFVYGMIR